jgi:ABC-type transporter Mla subunit MlaD
MIALGLNVMLGGLLICGLMMGLRLDRRLRDLRDSHAGFAKAVAELDQAAARTESSLAALRAGTEQARTDLAARIEQARLLTQRLDKLTLDAGRVLEEPLTLTRPLASGMRPAIERPAREPVIPRPVSAAAPSPGSSPRTSARSRVMVDDDLFETVRGLDRRAPLAAVRGGRS